ncbi:kinesin-like protein KIF13B isoform X2 [Dreissena polymorpha]|uniref:kinesin-like protein KIF13B isoform X2 n=1 Tax=Dreissena polymorpha TaxID=45954 RepID=UPI0022650CE6|nr:kinesin-like protein KIF13B isoform X2 [Dreissena polymorpha]
MTTDKVQVAVRVRPVNRREIELNTKCVTDMDKTQTILYHPQDTPLDVHGRLGDGGGSEGGRGRRKAPKTFAFDHCFWSMDKENNKFASQQMVFHCLGEPVLQGAFEGYNGCIFAYGQTGSGKSYTMMGTADDKGIIPRLCDALFERIVRLENESTAIKVEVSYMEIYNEKVHDLLDLKGHKQNLKVREHNILGPYVDGLSTLLVTSFQDINNLMSEGNKSRTVAATNMNSESSRSHAVFNIIVTQTLTDLKTSVSGEKVSKLSLVDLAGSERAQKTGAMGDRLREGSNINKSLTTLGLVISALAESGKNKNKFVPYRDSVLTWLLKDNLGGNSKTVMVATISPAADNYEETLSTLRYADRAKHIVNHAVVNEDPNARIIRELREEVELLQKELKEAQSLKAPDLKEKLEESEKLLKEMRKTWEEKMAETEQIQVERHKALEEMGVSVETSGIKVQNSRFFLVNLNADPSLNELLVYYLKERTVVGCPNEETRPDIQLSGLGIQPEHCIVEIADAQEVYVTPVEGARTCVNGSVIKERTKVANGDRILWGNNHFFRLNTPIQNRPQASMQDADRTIDFRFAQEELMMKEFSNDPISETIRAVEKQYEVDKQVALEQQRQMYERQMQQLRFQLMSPGTPSLPFPPEDIRLIPSGAQSAIQRKYQQWAQDRDKMFKHSLSLLREEVVKANALVREANFLAEEMGKETEFHVTLQIPAANLSPNRRRGAFVCEPAIQVKRRLRGSQIWSMEKFENKIIDMREMYEDRKSQGRPLRVDDSDSSESDEGPPQKGDPFYESYENHNLIGVANVFLDCLFYDVTLNYHVPIISQQGEIAGKLHVEVSKLGGDIMERFADINCEDDDDENVSTNTPLVIRVKIHEARGLPKDLANFVFCQYMFWDHDDVVIVPPDINPDTTTSDGRSTKTVKFEHEQEFRVFMTEEFVEYAQEGALSIEIWGHKVVGFGQQRSQVDTVQRSNSLVDRWLEVSRKVELWVEIHEVNDQGEFAPVEVKPQADVPSAGVYQLRQGHARRILARVKSKSDSGTLPLICDSISSLSIGCICARSRLQKGLDSYQEEDLNTLREHWSDALARRKTYLDSQIQALMNKQDKTEADSDRERALIDQWVSLTEERNAVFVPAAGSGIPGAPADWVTPPNMEHHRPVLFLDLNSDDMTTPSVKEGSQAAGINSILPKEQSVDYLHLANLRAYTEGDQVCAVASWDSSMHDSQHLNRITGNDSRVYLILKVVLRLSHPAYMEVVLRKRLSVNVKHRNMSLTDKIMKKVWTREESMLASGITFDVVSNIPKASEDLEHMESLAQMAASQNEVSAEDGETYIEKYIRGVSAVESILTLDRLRQEVAVKELMAKKGRSLHKTSSVPNIHQLMTTPPRLDERMRFDSIQDLTFHTKSAGSTPVNIKSALSALSPLDRRSNVKPLQTLREEHHSRDQKQHLLDSEEEDNSYGESPRSSKQSSLDAKKTLDLDVSLDTSSSKHELLETKNDLLSLKEEFAKLKKSIIEPRKTSPIADDFQDFESYESQQLSKQVETGNLSEVVTNTGEVKRTAISHSVTCDSITECQGKGTPSMTSSGYGSQAVSTLTLSSEDSLSLRSNEDSEGHGGHRKPGLEHAGSGDSDGDDVGQFQGQVMVSSLEVRNCILGDQELDREGVTGMLSASNDTIENMCEEDADDKDTDDRVTLADDCFNYDDDGNVDLGLDDSDDDEESSEVLKLHISEEDLSKIKEDGVSFGKHGSDIVQSLNAGGMNRDRSKVPTGVVNDSHIQLGNINVNKSIGMSSVEIETKVEHNRSVSGEDVGEKHLKSESHSSKLDSEEKVVFNSSRSSDSSSNTSRGRRPLHSESMDPYSMEAMEELERLGDEFGPDNSEFTMNMTNTSIDTDGDKSNVKDNIDSGGQELNDSFSNYDLAMRPENHSTPLGKDRRRKEGTRSEPRQRPVSCIVTSDTKFLDSSLQEQSKRSSLTFSDEHLSEDGMSVCSFGSRADLDRLAEIPVPSWIVIGESVIVTASKSAAQMTGVVQFVGNVEFASGPWVGVELDLPEGKNNGSVHGIQYFKCRPRHGLFVRHDKVILDKKRRGSRKSAASLMSRKSTGAGKSSQSSPGAVSSTGGKLGGSSVKRK